MKSNIVVVGGGATALSFLQSVYDEIVRSGVAQSLTIYVVEKRRFKGRGLAYDLDVPSNLLNTRAGFITPFADKPGHFYEWLEANKGTWEDEFPFLNVSADTFVPRPLFGLYLEYMMSDLAGLFAAIGVELVHVRGEVVALEAGSHESIVAITAAGLRIRAEHAVLCCGNLQSKEHSSLEAHTGFHASPYPIGRLTRNAKTKSSVAILGARLSAIDVALGLANGGFEGTMTMVSRSGYFPSVRGTQGRYTPTIMTHERLQQQFERHGPVRLSLIVNWMMQELVAAGSPVLDVASLPPAAPADVVSFFENEIAAAASPRPWQAVLYATNSIIDYLWQILHDDDRAMFMVRYAAAWMSYRVSIPAENAARIVDLAKKGQLSFRTGAASVAPEEGGGFTVAILTGASAGSSEHFDMVVGAFGTPRDAAQLDSDLIGSLLSSGMASAHRHGGLAVDPATGALINAYGTVSRQVSVLGELTSGVHFFTSVLEINARHAARLAKRLCAQPSIHHRLMQIEVPMASSIPPPPVPTTVPSATQLQ